MADRFLLIFFTVCALTLICGGAAIAIAINTGDPAPPFMDRAFNTSIGLFTLGVGAIFGLLGGREGPRGLN